MTLSGRGARLVRARVANSSSVYFPFYASLREDGGPKAAFLEILKIDNGIKTDPWKQDRRQEPLKTVAGSGFEKT